MAGGMPPWPGIRPEAGPKELEAQAAAKDGDVPAIERPDEIRGVGFSGEVGLALLAGDSDLMGPEVNS